MGAHTVAHSQLLAQPIHNTTQHNIFDLSARTLLPVFFWLCLFARLLSVCWVARYFVCSAGNRLRVLVSCLVLSPAGLFFVLCFCTLVFRASIFRLLFFCLLVTVCSFLLVSIADLASDLLLRYLGAITARL